MQINYLQVSAFQICCKTILYFLSFTLYSLDTLYCICILVYIGVILLYIPLISSLDGSYMLLSSILINLISFSNIYTFFSIVYTLSILSGIYAFQWSILINLICSMFIHHRLFSCVIELIRLLVWELSSFQHFLIVLFHYYLTAPVVESSVYAKIVIRQYEDYKDF